jgi:hypothetical protein
MMSVRHAPELLAYTVREMRPHARSSRVVRKRYTAGCSSRAAHVTATTRCYSV